MSEEMEKAIQNVNRMDEIRKIAQKNPEVKKHFMENLRPSKQGSFLCNTHVQKTPTKGLLKRFDVHIMD